MPDSVHLICNNGDDLRDSPYERLIDPADRVDLEDENTAVGTRQSQSGGMIVFQDSQRIDFTYQSACSMPMFKGIIDDIKRRAPHYVDDWTSGFHPLTMSASLFMFFTSVFPALIFGEVLEQATLIDPTNPAGGSYMSVPQVLLATGLTGVVWSIFAGQPLVIVGVTGPVAIFMTCVYQLAEGTGVSFMKLHCWTCILSALMHWGLAISGSCDGVQRVTRFAGESFGFFIAIIYIQKALIFLFDFGDSESDEARLYTFNHKTMDGWLGFGTFMLALMMHHARDWTIFNGSIRDLSAQYGCAFAIFVWTGVSKSSTFKQGNPVLLSDILQGYDGTGVWTFNNPFDDEVDAKTIGIAIPAAMLLTLLFFFDHNVSSLLSQDPCFNLKKGTAYHYDFVILGCNVLLCGLLGIPPSNGLIPQAPLHVRALATIKTVESGGVKSEVYESIREQRLSNLLQSGAMCLMIVPSVLKVVAIIPKAVLMGSFLYMGIVSFDGNTFCQRLLFLIQDPEHCPEYEFLKDRPDKEFRKTVKNYTLVQFAIWMTIYVMSMEWAGVFVWLGVLDGDKNYAWQAVGIVFPFLIAVLVPVRERLLPAWFDQKAIDILDFTAPEATESVAMQEIGEGVPADEAGSPRGVKVMPDSAVVEISE
jgi:hypothetical protein